jgi:hypothetical protein
MENDIKTEAAIFSRFIGKSAGPRVTDNQGILQTESIHKTGDPEGIERFMIYRDNLSIELFPSKGLCVGEAFYKNRPLFWKPPIEFLPHPDIADPASEVLIGDQKVAGLGFIRGFTGGIEMLGLDNWGMHYFDEDTKKTKPLHGDVSLRPVHTVEIFHFKHGAVIRGSFYTRDREGDMGVPWHQRGKSVFLVTKRLIIDDITPGFYIVDTVKNCGDTPIVPDWGYHVQLRPEPGAVYRVPARKVSARGGGAVPVDFEEWSAQGDSGKRIEHGYIHRGAMISDNLLGGKPGIKTLLSYADGTGILAIIPPSPFLLSWFSAGGDDCTEFLLPEESGRSPSMIFSGPWNGIGPEIGASALDHDGNVDPAVTVEPVQPGEEQELAIKIEIMDRSGAGKVSEEILSYSRQRVQN